MNTATISQYKPRTNYQYRSSRPSQYEQTTKKDPIGDEVNRLCGVYQLTAKIEPDRSTLELFKGRVQNFVAFLCSIERNGELLGQGRGTATIGSGQYSKYITRGVQAALSASLVDAMVRSTRIGALLPETSPKSQTLGVPVPEVFKAREVTGYEDILSDKQRSYILELVCNLSDEERTRYENSVDSLTRSEASKLIQILRQ